MFTTLGRIYASYASGLIWMLKHVSADFFPQTFFYLQKERKQDLRYICIRHYDYNMHFHYVYWHTHTIIRPPGSDT